MVAKHLAREAAQAEDLAREADQCGDIVSARGLSERRLKDIAKRSTLLSLSFPIGVGSYIKNIGIVPNDYTKSVTILSS